MAARRIKNSWWIDLRFNHTRYRKRSPENSRAGALAYEAVLRQRLARGEDINARPIVAESFSSFAERWYEDYVLVSNKPSEQRGKRYILNASLLPFFGKMPIDAITIRHIEQYKAREARTGVSAKTINNRLTVLHRCLGTAYEWLEIEKLVPRAKLLKAAPGRTEYLSEEESRRLVSHTTGVVHEMLLLALRTGMRQGEIKGLQWSSIDWDNRYLVVRHSRSDIEKTLGSPKSNRERYIPLDQELYDLLIRRRQEDGYVFVMPTREPFTHRVMSAALKRVCLSAGLRRITWHVLRHTFASHLAMKGVPVPTIQSLLGHSTITMTMRYAHVAPSTLRTAIDLLSNGSVEAERFGQPLGNPWLPTAA